VVRSSPKIKRLRQEIEEIRKLFDESIPKGKFHEDALQIEKEKMIKSQVISDCTLVEEVLSIIIMDHILKDSKRWREVKYFGRTKRFRMLYDEILGRISPFQKIEIVKQLIKLPHKIESTTRKIFDLRNLFAHTYTLDYTKKRKILYNGVNIFDVENFKKYWDDSIDMKRFFIRRSKILRI